MSTSESSGDESDEEIPPRRSSDRKNAKLTHTRKVPKRKETHRETPTSGAESDDTTNDRSRSVPPTVKPTPRGKQTSASKAKQKDSSPRGRSSEAPRSYSPVMTTEQRRHLTICVSCQSPHLRSSEHLDRSHKELSRQEKMKLRIDNISRTNEVVKKSFHRETELRRIWPAEDDYLKAEEYLRSRGATVIPDPTRPDASVEGNEEENGEEEDVAEENASSMAQTSVALSEDNLTAAASVESASTSAHKKRQNLSIKQDWPKLVVADQPALKQFAKAVELDRYGKNDVANVSRVMFRYRRKQLAAAKRNPGLVVDPVDPWLFIADVKNTKDFVAAFKRVNDVPATLSNYLGSMSKFARCVLQSKLSEMPMGFKLSQFTLGHECIKGLATTNQKLLKNYRGADRLKAHDADEKIPYMDFVAYLKSPKFQNKMKEIMAKGGDFEALDYQIFVAGLMFEVILTRGQRNMIVALDNLTMERWAICKKGSRATHRYRELAVPHTKGTCDAHSFVLNEELYNRVRHYVRVMRPKVAVSPEDNKSVSPLFLKYKVNPNVPATGYTSVGAATRWFQEKMNGGEKAKFSVRTMRHTIATMNKKHHSGDEVAFNRIAEMMGHSPRIHRQAYVDKTHEEAFTVAYTFDRMVEAEAQQNKTEVKTVRRQRKKKSISFLVSRGRGRRVKCSRVSKSTIEQAEANVAAEAECSSDDHSYSENDGIAPPVSEVLPHITKVYTRKNKKAAPPHTVPRYTAATDLTGQNHPFSPPDTNNIDLPESANEADALQVDQLQAELDSERFSTAGFEGTSTRDSSPSLLAQESASSNLDTTGVQNKPQRYTVKSNPFPQHADKEKLPRSESRDKADSSKVRDDNGGEKEKLLRSTTTTKGASVDRSERKRHSQHSPTPSVGDNGELPDSTRHRKRSKSNDALEDLIDELDDRDRSRAAAGTLLPRETVRKASLQRQQNSQSKSKFGDTAERGRAPTRPIRVVQSDSPPQQADRNEKLPKSQHLDTLNKSKAGGDETPQNLLRSTATNSRKVTDENGQRSKKRRSSVATSPATSETDGRRTVSAATKPHEHVYPKGTFLNRFSRGQQILDAHINNNFANLTLFSNLPNRGRGGGLTEECQKEDFVASYNGEIITTAEHFRRQSERNPARRQLANAYKVQYGKDYIIEAHRESGHIGRLLNHSKVHSNVKLTRRELITGDGNTRIVPLFEAKRKIGAGEELVWNYDGYEDQLWAAQCYCVKCGPEGKCFCRRPDHPIHFDTTPTELSGDRSVSPTPSDSPPAPSFLLRYSSQANTPVTPESVVNYYTNPKGKLASTYGSGANGLCAVYALHLLYRQRGLEMSFEQIRDELGPIAQVSTATNDNWYSYTQVYGYLLSTGRPFTIVADHGDGRTLQVSVGVERAAHPSDVFALLLVNNHWSALTIPSLADRFFPIRNVVINRGETYPETHRNQLIVDADTLYAQMQASHERRLIDRETVRSGSSIGSSVDSDSLEGSETQPAEDDLRAKLVARSKTFSNWIGKFVGKSKLTPATKPKNKIDKHQMAKAINSALKATQPETTEITRAAQPPRSQPAKTNSTEVPSVLHSTGGGGHYGDSQPFGTTAQHSSRSRRKPAESDSFAPVLGRQQDTTERQTIRTGVAGQSATNPLLPNPTVHRSNPLVRNSNAPVQQSHTHPLTHSRNKH